MRRPAVAHVLVLLGAAAIGSAVIAGGVAGANQSEWGLQIAVFVLVTLVVGWLLAWRGPRIDLGWTLLAIALLFALQGPTGALGTALAAAHPGLAGWLLWYGGDNQWSWIPPIGLLFTQLPLRFPDGRLPSPGWRWFSRATVAAIAVASVIGMTQGRTVGAHVANPTYLDLGAATDPLGLLGLGVLVPALVGSVGSLVPRYRRADDVERTQVRWILWAVAVSVGLLVSDWFLGFALAVVAPPLAGPVTDVLGLAAGFGYSLIPLSILFAVLRYRLYDIDRIISRTTAYALVTLLVVGTYALVVLATSLLLPRTVGVALATLAAAAVFLPVLRWVRRRIDRRFDRAGYDALEVVERFGERIRNGADPTTAGPDLMGAVAQALQPASVGLWTPGEPR